MVQRGSSSALEYPGSFWRGSNIWTRLWSISRNFSEGKRKKCHLGSGGDINQGIDMWKYLRHSRNCEWMCTVAGRQGRRRNESRKILLGLRLKGFEGHASTCRLCPVGTIKIQRIYKICVERQWKVVRRPGPCPGRAWASLPLPRTCCPPELPALTCQRKGWTSWSLKGPFHSCEIS